MTVTQLRKSVEKQLPAGVRLKIKAAGREFCDGEALGECSEYYRLITTCENEYELFSKIRFADHANTSSARIEPDFNFATDCDNSEELAVFLRCIAEELAVVENAH